MSFSCFQCCACYGPKGGRGNYCGTACTKRNAGTVTKNAYVWFWIRTRQPHRVWKRCMQFKVKLESGKTETYHIDRLTGTSHKVNNVQIYACSGVCTVSHHGPGFCLFLPALSDRLNWSETQLFYSNNRHYFL